ncbi:hypothetical protein BXQ17_10560 [Polaribacter sp. BM10]|uniref:hypothetical protein n=1 Tax=Polaribacter sp. BM10 TaxID=1529069 RepID=UPI00098B53C6|nr:hypothetical protein [Polaribacter sp. BM10]AQS94478.1 hypothetical protein BXQ17_10560 [Polaribacter sp. BM10]
MKKICLLYCFLLFLNCSEKDGLFINDNIVVNNTSITTIGGANNDAFTAVEKTADGGFIAAGYTQSNNLDITDKSNTSFDFFISKFSSDNQLEWQKTFGGSDDDRAADIIETKNGEFAILGYSKSNDLDVSVNAGSQDFWFIKLSSSGILISEKSFGYLGLDYGTTLLETKDNGFLITGVLDITASNGQGNAKTNAIKHAGGDYWAIKTDNSGNLLWSKYFGGSFTDTPLGVVETDANDFIIVGSSDSNDFNISDNKGTYDFWVVKISNSGNLIWEKSFGGSEIDEARAITTTNDGNFIIVGDTRSNDKDVSTNNGAADIWVLKISTDGNLIWKKTIGATNFDVARAITKTKDNGFLIAGSSRSLDNGFENKGQNDALIIKINNTGELLWQQTFGGSKIDFLYDITVLNNTSIIAVGESNSFDKDIPKNKGFTDALIIKL